MRLISDFSIEIADYIQKCIEWKIDTEFEDDHLFLSNFINFIKHNYFKTSPIIKQVFEDYKLKPNDQRLRGMFELCMEMGLKEIPNKKNELEKRLIKLKDLEKAHVKEPQHKVDEKLQVEKDPTTGNSKISTKNKHPIIIYWNFDKESEYALMYAIRLSKRIHTELTLVHFANKGKEHIAAIKKLRILITKYQSEFNVKIHAKIKEKKGNLTRSLEASTDIEAQFVILGTNGYKKDLNVIAGSNIPALIVQNTPNDTIKTVLFPIDDRKEIKHKLVMADLLNQIYKPKFLISCPKKVSIDAIRSKVLNNQKFSEAYFRKINAEYEVLKVEEGSSFNDITIQTIEQQNPDIVIVLPKESVGFTGFNISNDEKKLIDKCNKTPIIFVNSINTIVTTIGAGIIY